MVILTSKIRGGCQKNQILGGPLNGFLLSQEPLDGCNGASHKILAHLSTILVIYGAVYI